MTKTQRLRMTIDITMTILSIILMGGNYLFPADIVHEILGVGLFVLWAVHIILNRPWNQTCTFPSSNYKRCTGWEMINAQLEKLD